MAVGKNIGEQTFAAALRSMRTDAGLSLTDLAEAARYSKGYISKVETGARSPSLAFARACDATLDAAGALITLVRSGSRSTEPRIVRPRRPVDEVGGLPSLTVML